MNFTFGIITASSQLEGLQRIINSIERERIPNYEIVVIGNAAITGRNIRAFAFDESQKKAWITKKKNLVTEYAQYENIVYMHDYIALEPGWYQGFLRFGGDFAVCMTRMLNFDSSRYRDWTLWAGDAAPCGVDCRAMHFLLPYDVTHLWKYQYFSGAYWVAKKAVMQKFPLDESKGWGEGEDVEWSKLVRNQYRLSINPHSIVKLQKPGKSTIFQEMTPLEQNYVRSLQVDDQGLLKINGNQ